MSRNSFKELEQENRDRFSDVEDQMKQKISSNFNFLKFVSSMFDVFIPGIVRLIGGFRSDSRHESDGAPSPTKPNFEEPNSKHYPNRITE